MKLGLPSTAPHLRAVDRYLLLLCRDELDSLDVSSLSQKPVRLSGRHEMLTVLLDQFGARPDARCPDSQWTCVHQLVFGALEAGVGSFSNSSGTDPPCLTTLTRFAIEPLLEELLLASMQYGYIGDAVDSEAADNEQHNEQQYRHRREQLQLTHTPNLLDLPDQWNRTPLVRSQHSWQQADIQYFFISSTQHCCLASCS